MDEKKLIRLYKLGAIIDCLNGFIHQKEREKRMFALHLYEKHVITLHELNLIFK